MDNINGNNKILLLIKNKEIMNNFKKTYTNLYKYIKNKKFVHNNNDNFTKSNISNEHNKCDNFNLSTNLNSIPSELNPIVLNNLNDLNNLSHESDSTFKLNPTFNLETNNSEQITPSHSHYGTSGSEILIQSYITPKKNKIVPSIKFSWIILIIMLITIAYSINHTIYNVIGVIYPSVVTYNSFISQDNDKINIILKYWIVYSFIMCLFYALDIIFLSFSCYCNIKFIIIALIQLCDQNIINILFQHINNIISLWTLSNRTN
jgi:hypothetical protein